VISSLLAAGTPRLRAGELALAGQGFRDATRLAEGDPALWASILEGNRAPVAAQARQLGTELARLAEVLDAGDAAQVTAAVGALMDRGRIGRALLPRKARAQARPWGWVGVVLDDRPGQLAALFGAVGGWQINVEDVGPFEHSMQSPAGIVELAVSPDVADDLVDRLGAAGWLAYRRS
jgi:prephenate dehydrogenase